jgi:hypothetical protein
MKQLLIATGLLLLFSSFSYDKLVNVLCKDNEVVMFSFTLNNSKKSACLCKDKNGKYLVYRFGTNDKVELQYPKILDTSSWKAFILDGQKRFGGKANAGFADYSLSFKNVNVEYILFDTWSDEGGSKEIGIKMNINGKQTILKGNYRTKKGTLLRLDDETDKISNTADEEQ